MTTPNPNNYVGATTTLVGWLSQDPEWPAYDREGKKGRKQVRIPIREGYTPQGGEFKETGTTWYTYTANEDIFGNAQKGDKVRIENAKQESRDFTRKDGSIGQAFDLNFGTFTILESNDPDPFA